MKIWISALSALVLSAALLGGCAAPSMPSGSLPGQTTATATTATATAATATAATTAFATSAATDTAAPTNGATTTTDVTTAATTAATTAGKTAPKTTCRITTRPASAATLRDKDTVVDLDGYTFTYASPRPVTADDAAAGAAPLWEEQLLASAQAVSAQYNCRITFKTLHTGPDHLKSYILAGRTPADVLEMTGVDVQVAAKRRYLMPFERVTEEERIINIADARWDSACTEAGRSPFDGKLYGVCSLAYMGAPAVSDCVIVNKTLLRAVGKNPDALYDAVEKGTWRFDMLREYSLAASSKEGAWGITGPYTLLAEAFVRANGGRLLYVEEGKAVQGLGSDAVKTALVYLSRLVNEDKTVYFPAALYDVDNWGIYDDSEAWRCFLDGNVAFLVQSGAVLSRQLRGKVSFDYGLLPLPAGPDAVGYAMSAQNSTLLCIAESHRTPERAAILLNALMRPLSEGAHMQAVRDTCLQPGDTRSLMSYRVCLDSGAVDLGYAITPMVESLHFMAARLVLWGHDPDTVEAVDFSKEIDAVY